MTKLASLTVHALGVLVLSCITGCSDSGGSASGVGDTGGGGGAGGGGSTGGGGSSWTTGTYTGPGFQVSGFESSDSSPSIRTSPDGALWVSAGANLAHVSSSGGLVDAWRLNSDSPITSAKVIQNGIESEVELWAYGSNSLAWGPVLAPGTLPTTVRRLQGLTDGYLYITRAGESDPWFAYSYEVNPTERSCIAGLTTNGQLAWSAGFDRRFFLLTQSDGSIFLNDPDPQADEFNFVHISSSGTISYQKALAGFGSIDASSHEQGSLLLADIKKIVPGEYTVRVAHLSPSTGQVSAAWQLTPPATWKWASAPSIRTDSTGLTLCGIARPDPPILDSYPTAGASLVACRYTPSGSLTWMREFRMGTPGTAPLFHYADVYSAQPAGAHVVRWGGYPNATLTTSGGTTLIELGDPVYGFTVLSLSNGNHWSRLDWLATSLSPAGGGADLVLQYSETVARFSSSGSHRWTRLRPPNTFLYQSSDGNTEQVIGYELVSDPASSTGESYAYSKHSMDLSGPSGFRLGSLIPLRRLQPWSQVPDAPGLAWGTRSTPSGYRPLVARVDSQGRPTDWCMGASMNYGSASTPGTPYSLLTGNAPAPTKTNLNLSTENRNFATSADFTITTESLTLTPISASLLSPCD